MASEMTGVKVTQESCWNMLGMTTLTWAWRPFVSRARCPYSSKIWRSCKVGAKSQQRRSWLLGHWVEPQVCKFTRALSSQITINRYKSDFQRFLFFLLFFWAFLWISCLAMLGDASCCTMLCRAPRWKKPWLRSDGSLGKAKTCGLERLTAEKDTRYPRGSYFVFECIHNYS